MNIDVTQILRGFDGEPLQRAEHTGTDADGNDQVVTHDLTLRFVLMRAMNVGEDDVSKATRMFELAVKINSEDTITLTANDAEFIAGYLTKAQWSPVVVGQAKRILDGNSPFPEIESDSRARRKKNRDAEEAPSPAPNGNEQPEPEGA